MFIATVSTFFLLYPLSLAGETGGSSAKVAYRHTLTPVDNPEPILADYPDYVAPLHCERRYSAPPVVNDKNGLIRVRSWRYSYAVRGIIEMENRLDPKATAIINVHPWGCDDGHGLRTPEPNGVILFCTPAKNEIGNRHTVEVINPFLKRLRQHVSVIGHSLPGEEDPLRKKLYPSISTSPDELNITEGETELSALISNFPFKGSPLISRIKLDRNLPLPGYFDTTNYIDAGDYYNGPGFWDIPIPLLEGVDFGPGDVVLYDDDGYGKVRDYLKKQGVRHVLMTGHLTDVCVTHTTCGFLTMSRDFNVFLVGDATLAAFPASTTPKYAAQAALADASLNQMITQISWIRIQDGGTGE